MIGVLGATCGALLFLLVVASVAYRREARRSNTLLTLLEGAVSERMDANARAHDATLAKEDAEARARLASDALNAADLEMRDAQQRLLKAVNNGLQLAKDLNEMHKALDALTVDKEQN